MQAFPDRNPVSISKAAANPEMYLGTWRYLRRYGAAPRTVVVQLNPRSLSSTLDYRPDSEFPRIQYEMYWDGMVSRALYRPLAIFQAIQTQPLNQGGYARLLRTELDEAPSALQLSADRRAEGEARWNGMTFREHFYLRYGAPISPKHPALLALTDLVEALRSEGVSALFYLTPVDVERGRKELGGDIDALLDYNRRMFHDVLAPFLTRDSGIQFFDASELLPSADFMHDYGPPNEHLYDSGLTRLFGELQPRIEALLARVP